MPAYSTQCPKHISYPYPDLYEPMIGCVTDFSCSKKQIFQNNKCRSCPQYERRQNGETCLPDMCYSNTQLADDGGCRCDAYTRRDVSQCTADKC